MWKSSLSEKVAAIESYVFWKISHSENLALQKLKWRTILLFWKTIFSKKQLVFWKKASLFKKYFLWKSTHSEKVEVVYLPLKRSPFLLYLYSEQVPPKASPKGYFFRKSDCSEELPILKKKLLVKIFAWKR